MVRFDFDRKVIRLRSIGNREFSGRYDGAFLFIVATGARSRGSCGRKSVGVRVGAAGLPPTHVGSFRGGPD
jgi:hypothetical protein